eukprot:TRINITY_DN47049_c0_g2_i1.p1 TRINITY_DN47049_c0_g2~~TRINITY_DN47049_c0_g2_i1.p1  ORF type:complete len:420 (+),score=89.50 TRINITY_DN47049_c0_g2_i1:84-1343(+)
MDWNWNSAASWGWDTSNVWSAQQVWESNAQGWHNAAVDGFRAAAAAAAAGNGYSGPKGGGKTSKGKGSRNGPGHRGGKNGGVPGAARQQPSPAANIEEDVSEEEDAVIAGGWEESWEDVLSIRFSQEQIHPFFHRRGPITDVLPEIGNKLSEEETTSDNDGGDSDDENAPGAPTVQLLPPFDPIRCVLQPDGLHADLITLDNRRLYALQMAAVERWPARCFVKVRVPAEGDGLDVLQANDGEMRKLDAGGRGPLGKFEGKPKVFIDNICGDVEVLVASRGSAWEPWNVSHAILARCGSDEERNRALEMFKQKALPNLDGEANPREACEDALRLARQALSTERIARQAAADAEGITAHTVAQKALLQRLEILRLVASRPRCNGVLVRRTGKPGDRDGYISVAGQAAALQTLENGSGGATR